MNKYKIKIAQLYLAYKEDDISLIAKFFAILTLGYALSPIDLIPDFIPVIGYLDDIIIIPLLLYITMLFISKESLEKHYEKAKTLVSQLNGKWYYSFLIIFIWLFIAGVVVALIVNK